MAESIVATLRAGYEAYNRDGVEATLEFLDPAIEWRNPVDSPIAGVWRGHDGVREWHRQALESFAEMRFQPDEYLSLDDDRVLVMVTAWVRGQGSEIEMEMPFAHLWRFREGRAVEMQMYSDVEQARRDAGLDDD